MMIVNINKQLITQLLSCIGAGALLGLAMIDILPELREKISRVPKESNHHGSSHIHSGEEEESGFFSDHYPLAELGMLISTFLVAILDVFIQRIALYFSRQMYMLNYFISKSIKRLGFEANKDVFNLPAIN